MYLKSAVTSSGLRCAEVCRAMWRDKMVSPKIESRTLDLAELGIRTRVLDAGQGPVVLMLHGNPDNADEWAQLIARLAGSHRCIAPDFPGYGQSPEPPPSFSYSLADQM